MSTVAIIEENENWIKIFADFFHTIGYSVSAFKNAEEILNTPYKTKMADAIIYPLYMGKSDWELVGQIKKRFVKTPLIMFLPHPDIPECIGYLKNHANALVLKKDGLFNLHTAIMACHNGGTYISPAITKALISQLLFGENASLDIHFSSKEKEIISLLKEGLSYKQMANKLGITTFTVNHHLKKIYKKTGVNSRLQLLAMLEKR